MRDVDLMEYQAKELLKRYQVPTQDGIAVESADDAVKAYEEIAVAKGGKFAVVKAQIHAGGRGKGTMREVPEQNGVKVVKSAEEVRSVASNILGNTLVTIQTGEAGKKVNKILVAQDMYYDGPSERKEPGPPSSHPWAPAGSGRRTKTTTRESSPDARPIPYLRSRGKRSRDGRSALPPPTSSS